jgi:hypothetical protein
MNAIDHEKNISAPQFRPFDAAVNFARNYLDTYYCGQPTTDEEIVLEFLSREYRKIKDSPAMVEIGCGPTLHHVIPAAPYVSEIHMADYLDENLEEVRQWKQDTPRAHNWSRFTALTLALEGADNGSSAVENRESEVRKKISGFYRYDFKNHNQWQGRSAYSAVASFYTVEQVITTKPDWKRLMGYLSALVAPGGRLFLSSLLDTDFYHIYGTDGSTQKFPACPILQKDFEDVLPELGFDMADAVIDTKVIEGQQNEGVNGVILVSARKKL